MKNSFVKKKVIGILDYGAGNTASVRHTISRLGYRSRLIREAGQLNSIALLLVPGVGAFPAAMQCLQSLDLIMAVQKFAQQGKGVIGVCLGMQLLAEASDEQGYTEGLGLIPGKVEAIVDPHWHIGWNTLMLKNKHPSLMTSDQQAFYFNHAYEFHTADQYILAVADVLTRPLVAVVAKGNIYGFQFHPEKSQQSGLQLIKNTIEGLLDA